jgi:hypothetical protein
MNNIYQLKIELKGSEPAIWRRIQVAEDTSFSDLHDILQLTMGWENNHLYEFKVNKIKVYDFEEKIDDGSNPTERDSMDTFLNDIVNLVKTKFTYTYDFGDNWEHEIQVEKILPADKENPFPICLGGERACPPEDCGGILGYQNLLSILSNKNHPEYEEISTWLGGDWDAESFNCDHVNVLLQDYAEQWEEIYKETGEILDKLEGNSDDEDDWDADDDWDEDDWDEDEDEEEDKK